MSPDLVALPLSAALVSNSVQVWYADLDRLPIESLVAADQQRASRFAFELHRRRFLASRCFLRRVLASRVDGAPDDIRLVLGLHGKPATADHAGLHFNLAHSEATALLALAPRAIGVDVEVLRPFADADLLAKCLYSEREREWIEAAVGDERPRRFLQCWTRKEACLKAIGCGLAIEPGSFDVVTGFGSQPVNIRWNEWLFALSLHEFGDAQGRWIASVALVDARADVRAERSPAAQLRYA